MNVRKKTVDGFELSFSSDWVHHLEGQEHWTFYWHQARLIEDRVALSDHILEIGVGTKFLSNYLRSRNRIIQTLDIDAEKKPDHVGDASAFDYANVNPHTVLAFEVFEHLPFPLFRRVIQRLADCNVRQILFSVPWCEKKLFRGQFKLPRLKPYRFALTLPWRTVTTPSHFWELDPFSNLGKTAPVVQESNKKILVPMAQLRTVLSDCGYTVSLEKKVDYIQFFSARR